ncbi:probable arginine--tRNA ligase, mitochondrial [Centruroides sculpturatus]|uniref:probable arginine--tRNA ligase, mitochondrial n=1 Tax=Centruroides sculpturatus TaxID=218467 RepID=UPI000C6CD429|nr:probable arginine--tRNA ligase, mitochondrial [Centruroides sculpturatus]
MKDHDICVYSEGLVQLKVPVNADRELTVTLEKTDGSTLYISRDIAAVLDRKEKYNFDKAYYVVDNNQSDHFLSLVAILKILGYDWYSSVHHIKFGQIEGMSTRKGKLVHLKDLLEEAKSKAFISMLNSSTTRATNNMDEIADVIGMSAVMINDMKNRRQSNYKFDWDKVLYMKGDSATTLHYNHARLFSLERNCGVYLNPYCETKYLMEPEAVNLVQHIARFDETIMAAYNKLEPHIIVRYLFALCYLIGKANKTLPVKNQDKVIAMSRLFLFHTSRIVLGTGMKLLGLQPLDMM